MMSNKKTQITLDNIKQGDHLCSIYQNKEQQFGLIIPFFEKGLNNNEKCIYIADDNSTDEVVAEFEKAGVAINKFIKSGKFVLLTKRETYLKNGYFDPEKMIQLLKNTEKDALNEGYSGVRGSGEMTWQIGSTGSNKLIEYEAKLNDFIPKSKLAVICQYNENRFAPEILTGVIHTHPLIILYGKLCKNLYFYSPAQYTKKENIFELVDSYKLMLNEIMGMQAS